ncbi:lactate utilization protein C [Desulfuromonas versatilis]|uniref:Lactate utilization protein C n=1 Tax=Desulfuromonas versatilis TaxID=2802975 RepID=A0ABM8HVM4_9BACT|nr:lactate utilization protein [Desulfuromonas versatilis]BCR05151.1 lactate utilization protein C [Desulfuromonas versatilis]
MDLNLSWHRRRLLDQTASALEKNGFSTVVFDLRQEALEYLLGEAGEAVTVGFGGSMTVAELGLAGRLREMGKTTLIHGSQGLTAEERRQIMQEQLNCDLFFTSTNALTVSGNLVNIDATGNRVCAMAFGPKKVIVVAGVNKIVMDLEAALKRVKQVASPPNAKRLGNDTPCAKTGLCSDCNSPQRICRITTILERRPRATDLRVCLINENLGY